MGPRSISSSIKFYYRYIERDLMLKLKRNVSMSMVTGGHSAPYWVVRPDTSNINQDDPQLHSQCRNTTRDLSFIQRFVEYFNTKYHVDILLVIFQISRTINDEMKLQKLIKYWWFYCMLVSPVNTNSLPGYCLKLSHFISH